MMHIPVVGVVTAMWKRHELTDIVFGNLAALRDSLRDIIDLRLVVAGSEGEASQTLAQSHGFAYAEVPNSPLGAKWNAALSLLRGQDIDGVCIVGSDDLLNANYFHMVAESLNQGEKLFGIDAFYIMDRFTGRIFLWMGYPPPRDVEVIGLGRFIHRDYIEALDWKLWDDPLEKSLDFSMRKRIEALTTATGMESQFGFKAIEEYNIVPLDIKHMQQMWSYESTALNCYQLRLVGDPTAFLGAHYNAETLNRVFAPCQSQAEPCDDIHLPPWKLSADYQLPEKNVEGNMRLALSLAHEEGVPCFVPYALRHHITYVPAANSSEDTLHALLFAFTVTRQQSPSVQLYVHFMDFTAENIREHGIGGYKVSNLHIWRNIFRVYIFEEDFSNARIIKKLLEQGTVVICCKTMKKFWPALPETAPFIVENMEEAVLLAQKIHADEKLWNTMSRQGAALVSTP